MRHPPCPSSLPLLFLLVALLPLPSHGDELQRRLDARAKRLDLRELEAGVLDDHGLLPEPEVGGLKLREVFLVRRSDPWRPIRSAVPEGYQARRGQGRRLGSLSTAANTAVNLNGPRSRVLALTLLNAATLPVVTYNSSVRWNDWGPLVYKDGTQAFAPTVTAIVNASAGGFTAGGSVYYNATEESLKRFREDVDALVRSRMQVRQNAGTKWSSDKFLGQRKDACLGATGDQEMCLNDIGVGMSVYEDANYKVLVFHAGWGKQDRQQTMWLHKDWVIEDFEESWRLTWTIKARQALDPAMLVRSGDRTVEKGIRCAFKAEQFKISDADIQALAAATSVSKGVLEQKGLWSITKSLVRTVLPETRRQDSKTVLLTGSGLGGARATLVSMWLAKADAKEYQTYSIAGLGWECAARRLYTNDLIPWQPHSKIWSYSHVMDAMANGLDRQPGKVCLYGRLSFNPSTPEHGYCSRSVGYTGAQLFHRGDPAPTADVADARLAFTACNYFTHSPWYAAILFLSESVLMYDGTTDGGCLTETPIPQTDSLKRCPDPADAEAYCNQVASGPRQLPIAAMLGVAGGILVLLGCLGVVFIICLKQLRNDAWVFGKDAYGRELRLFWFLDLFWKPKKKKKLTDRARAARERAHAKRRKAALKERERQLRREATEEERKIMKEEKAARKAAKAQEKAEAEGARAGAEAPQVVGSGEGDRGEAEPGIGPDAVDVSAVAAAAAEGAAAQEPLLAGAVGGGAGGVAAPPKPLPQTVGRTSLQAALPEAEPTKDGPVVLSLEDGLALQRDLMKGFGDRDFQEKLEELHETLKATSRRKFNVERQKLLLTVQSVVLPKYGFEGTPKGVMEVKHEFHHESHFLTNEEFQSNSRHLIQLLRESEEEDERAERKEKRDQDEKARRDGKKEKKERSKKDDKKDTESDETDEKAEKDGRKEKQEKKEKKEKSEKSEKDEKKDTESEETDEKAERDRREKKEKKEKKDKEDRKKDKDEKDERAERDEKRDKKEKREREDRKEKERAERKEKKEKDEKAERSGKDRREEDSEERWF